MQNILKEIHQHKLSEVRESKKTLSLTTICKNLKCSEKKPKDFIAALQKRITKNEAALICEVKKSSPSKGIIREDFNPVEIAKSYERAGAACISVLTDKKYFNGSNDYLAQIRLAVNLPILRKDFIVDAYQIYEAKMLGADCILLIVAMLDDFILKELEQIALSLNLSVLIEVHDEIELTRAFKLQSKLIGINNRNLKNFTVDINNSLKLANLVSQDYILVSESGIQNAVDIKKLQNKNINSFLIGEYFMKQDNIFESVSSLLKEVNDV